MNDSLFYFVFYIGHLALQCYYSSFSPVELIAEWIGNRSFITTPGFVDSQMIMCFLLEIT